MTSTLIKPINPITPTTSLTQNDYIMIIDVETNGFPEKLDFYTYHNYTMTEKYNNSRIIQISWGLYDKAGTLIKIVDYYVKPNGFTITNSEYHGITNEIVNEQGIDIKVIFRKLFTDLKKTSTVVGHNLMFDEHIILSELYRNKFVQTIEEFKKKQRHCTGIGTIDLLNIKLEKGANKMPSLDELYFWCFKEHTENAHNAKYDVLNTAKCYFYVKSGKWKATHKPQKIS